MEDQFWKVDLFVARFVSHGRAKSWRYYLVKHAVLALQLRFPRLNRQLTETWRRLSKWEATRPWRPRIPMSRTIMLYLFLVALDQAGLTDSEAHREQWQALAVLLRVGFGALLRPGEIFRLRSGDIQMITPPGRTLLAVIALAGPKTAWVKGAGRSQFATLRDPESAAWLQQWLSAMEKKRANRVWPTSRSAFNKFFKECVRVAGFGKLGFTPASLRAGGATNELLEGESMEAISFHGRWVSMASLRSYLQEGASHLVWSAIDEATRLKVESFLVRYRTILISPPARWP